MHCPKCTNAMTTSALVTSDGVEIMVLGTLASGHRPLSAQVCSACGYTELYAAQWTEEIQQARESAVLEAEPIAVASAEPAL
ncbi:hypothetical protein [Herpetosiphon llansteffanensis]|uniref:hypothetical protein n=1 Tax=Herpetosiphon llansteffanensis TaxID=2094568 RepID=UPI000F51AA1F|nr:hypothetical protein [Herpetosiphon llansteffanensis]